MFKYGEPLPLSDKAKEIMVLIVSRRGQEINNKEIYSTIWPDRGYSNKEMNVYYNALRRLKATLRKEGVEKYSYLLSGGR